MIDRLRPALLAVCLALPFAAPSAHAQFRLENAFPSLPSLDRPVDLQRTPGAPGRLFIVEQGGVVLSVDEATDGAMPDTLVDLTDVVMDIMPSWEEGLLGLAFHPDYAANGYLFVYYNTFPEVEDGPHRSIISRFTVAGESGRVDRSTEVVLFDIPQPLPWHNGGQLAFHPLEEAANLYISFGDGGGGGDPFNHAQDRSTLFGSVLRVDVDGAQGELPYGIPDDNPFVGNDDGWREEIWAYGLRNPWRFSIDPVTGWLWVGDVGQSLREEVSVIAGPGANLGWDVKEGPFCYDEPDVGEPLCSDPTLTDPIWWYPHENGDGSVTGGRVYRGTAIPDLAGQYVYADFISGRIWALDAESVGGPFNNELVQGFQVSTFGLDANDELYVASFNGRIYRLVQDPVSAEAGPGEHSLGLSLTGPNPVRAATTLAVDLDVARAARVAVYDVLGRRVQTVWDGTLTAGRHTLRLSAEGLAPGLYVVRLEAGATSSSVRLTVLR